MQRYMSRSFWTSSLRTWFQKKRHIEASPNGTTGGGDRNTAISRHQHVPHPRISGAKNCLQDWTLDTLKKSERKMVSLVFGECGYFKLWYC